MKDWLVDLLVASNGKTTRQVAELIRAEIYKRAPYHTEQPRDEYDRAFNEADAAWRKAVEP